jgi:hypothetical protein
MNVLNSRMIHGITLALVTMNPTKLILHKMHCFCARMIHTVCYLHLIYKIIRLEKLDKYFLCVLLLANLTYQITDPCQLK